MILKQALIQAARKHGILNDFGYVKEAMSVISGGSEEMFQLLKRISQDEHTYDPAIVERCCCYLFGKGVEAVVKWGLTKDGSFSVFYSPAHLVDMDLHAEVPAPFVKIVQESCAHGGVLFQAHLDWCEERLKSGAIDMAAEVRELFLQCSLLGMSYALERKYHETPGGGQGVVYREPVYSPEVRDAAQIGLNYYQGKGVPRNLSEAFRHLALAATQGHVSAQYALGIMYFRGEGVGQDYCMALSWFLRAAENGFPDAQHEVSVLLFNGVGCEPDHEKAFHWCQRAATQNVLEAVYNMGVFLYKGVGVAIDTEKAISCLKRAAEQGHVEAKRTLAHLKVV